MLNKNKRGMLYLFFFHISNLFFSFVRDGTLENLCGGGGGGGGVRAGEVQKKYSRKENLYENKFMHAN